MAVSSKIEEYLEAIYRLEEKMGVAKTSGLAKELKVTFGTITTTVENLETKGLLVHEPYRGVRLTEKGRNIALDVLRRHRLSERLLADILDMDWSEVHDAACKLEHAIADDVIENLEKALGHPTTCPHGNPIPTKGGRIVEEESEALTSLGIKEMGIIVKITEENPDVLRFLAKLGLMPGTSTKVEEKIPFDGPIVLTVKGTSRVLGRNVASIIKVKKP